jgi:hypothetical protein
MDQARLSPLLCVARDRDPRVGLAWGAGGAGLPAARELADVHQFLAPLKLALDRTAAPADVKALSKAMVRGWPRECRPTGSGSRSYLLTFSRIVGATGG